MVNGNTNGAKPFKIGAILPKNTFYTEGSSFSKCAMFDVRSTCFSDIVLA
jgi:hypothetical protein